ncbi:50S ribosomal protein L28 [Spirochaeta thermophila DSM 6578]|uniref:Large ribosomal subunit protein bL28 n=1 Tax=Winmispira thermophila (strain ATCC 700085 / DSM 6578 / Z-1203) TaxID=869211 RepID=G0GCT6_WINT7|nr:50S ribosomal protein L28 [Spirochaeta thermophila]AEJ60505.1 50S ribosomal protein L28 [Spirochaeta thermophila DSM 6578]
MARRCEICGKQTRSGFTVSHAHNRSKRTFKPNIQKIQIVDGKRVRTIKICTRCLRSGKVVKAV